MTKIQLLAGSYSDGAPTGLNLLGFDSATGELTHTRTLPGAADVSFIVRNGTTLYVTNEHAEGVAALSLAADAAAITSLGERSSEAELPCYLSLSPDRTCLAVANYAAGIAAVFTLDSTTGAIQPNPQILHGTQPDTTGHAHWVQWSPEGDRLYVVDLGHDEVRSYPWANGKAGEPVTAFSTPAGAGPRHLAFHANGRHAYLITEHGNTLIALERKPDGSFAELHTVSILPAGFTGKSQAAHIAINPAGTVVYVSNRGHHSIGAYAIGADGRLTHLQTISCGGDWPRFFLLSGNHLIVANQLSDNLVVFDVAADGTLTPSGKTLSLPKVVALLPL